MHYGRTITIFGLTLTPAPYMTLAPPAWLGLEFLDATEGGVQAPSLYLSQEDNGAYLYRPRGHQELTFGSNSSSLAFYIILSQHPEHQPTTAGFDVKVLCGVISFSSRVWGDSIMTLLALSELLSSPPPTEPRDRLDGPEYFGGTRKDQRVINWIHNVPSAQGSQARSPGPSQ